MSVQSQIDRLNTIKNQIRINLVAQGVTVPADTKLEEMAILIKTELPKAVIAALPVYNGEVV